MARVRAQQVPTEAVSINKREMYATVCYYFPQYTLRQVAKLPFRDVKLLIKTAQRIEAGKMYNFTQIAAAPHTKKMQSVKKLSEHFKKQAGK
jgi:hypothetical protein